MARISAEDAEDCSKSGIYNFPSRKAFMLEREITNYPKLAPKTKV